MRLSAIVNGAPSVRASRACRGFTLTELMIASTIFLMVVASLLVGNSFGMRMLEMTQPKLAASKEARRTMASLYDDISSARFVRIGNGSLNTFTNTAVGALKQGNAIQLYCCTNIGLALYSTTNTLMTVQYYFDPAEGKLKRVVVGTTNATVVANGITNLVFNGQDLAGNVLANDQKNMTVGVNLQYSSLGDSSLPTPVGAGNYFTSFLLQERIACHER